MKYPLLFCLIIASSATPAFGQVVNPTVIQQDTDIALHNTNVYYSPMAPPADTDTRAWLSNISMMLRDSNGLPDMWPPYEPMTHGVLLKNWTPPGDTAPLGITAVWQRLLTAKRKPNGTMSNIIAGGNLGDRVIISKNEDVDFRASGRVILKSGFHAKPGCFFHAYTEPKWDTAVFSDEFDNLSKFDSNWHISNGWGGNWYGGQAECLYDSNVRLVTDTDAHDGHAVDLRMREDTVDSCHCSALSLSYQDSCANNPSTSDTIPHKFIFSTGMIRSCPFPYLQRTDTPMVAAYAHIPYGKYEIREKIPHIQHHTNNWGGDLVYGFEYDLNETDDGANMGIISPDYGHELYYGPYTGNFTHIHDTLFFISSQPGWCASNDPWTIVVDNVPYQVQFAPGRGHDTLCGAGLMLYSDWPSSLANNTNPVMFYYRMNPNCVADVLPWHVDSTGRIFSAGYHVKMIGLTPDTLHFSKPWQPTSITLTYDAFGHKKTLHCHWEYHINQPDKGLLYLDDSLHPSDLHNDTEAYTFTMPGVLYPVPFLPFNANDTTGHYEYHTFAMEFLPHEVRYLVDSVVVRRFPDRLVPPSSPYYDWVSTTPRIFPDIRPAQTDFDLSTYQDSLHITHTDSLGTHPGTLMYQERKYFEHAAAFETAHPIPGWPGFEMINSKPVAHHLIDYVKVWDVPKDVFIPNLPR